jgi:hypothetical protein
MNAHSSFDAPKELYKHLEKLTKKMEHIWETEPNGTKTVALHNPSSDRVVLPQGMSLFIRHFEEVVGTERFEIAQLRY